MKKGIFFLMPATIGRRKKWFLTLSTQDIFIIIVHQLVCNPVNLVALAKKGRPNFRILSELFLQVR